VSTPNLIGINEIEKRFISLQKNHLTLKRLPPSVVPGSAASLMAARITTVARYTRTLFSDRMHCKSILAGTVKISMTTMTTMGVH